MTYCRRGMDCTLQRVTRPPSHNSGEEEGTLMGRSRSYRNLKSEGSWQAFTTARPKSAAPSPPLA